MKYRNPQGTLTEECMSWFVVLFLNVFTFGLFMFVYLIYFDFYNNNYFDVFTEKEMFENTKGL